ncbi:MAG: response regulator transcription factor [Lachnospiraceae bacterium]|nr:response regulator transcription factor [Lachnospiraceae bacterium]
MNKGRILVVEDYKEISRMLYDFLTEHGYVVECAYDGKMASEMLKKNSYTLVLMDLMLPYKSGDVLIGELREHSQTPVICLSAKSRVETRLEVLRMGADDFILKPFDLDEVLVRIEVVLRRSNQPETEYSGQEKSEQMLTCGELCLYPEQHRVTYRGENLALTSKELKLLELLMKEPDKTFTKANLYESVWNDVYYYEDNTINVHLSNLRSKLKKATGLEYIETVWGIGYRLKK